jgi:hypothetical protein
MGCEQEATAAIDRIESALARIDAMADRLLARHSVEISVSELKARHEALRHEMLAARDALSQIIGAEGFPQ